MAADVVEVVAPLDEVLVILSPTPEVVQLVEQGPMGPAGPVANQAQIEGYVDTAVDDYFVMHPDHWTYDQIQASTDWLITHPLDYKPAVTVTDSSGDIQEGVVTYPAANQVRIQFNVPIAGEAVLR